MIQCIISNMHVLLRMIYCLSIGASLFVFVQLQQISRSYDEQLAFIGSAASTVDRVAIDGNEVIIPSYQLFKNDGIWSLISKQRPLGDATKPALVLSPIPHGDSDDPMLVSVRIVRQLTALYSAAQADGVDLMVSSGHRTREAQQALFDLYLTTRGREFTATHVSPAGASEHQTGLAVDFSTASLQCAADSDKCELTYQAISWLADNAPQYGFVQRYPMGKQSITGIANEAWHYRYVGKTLAVALTNTGLTLDEFVVQVAPGYAK